MAKKFKSFETRDKPRKRGPRQHKKNKNVGEPFVNMRSVRKNRRVTKAKVK